MSNKTEAKGTLLKICIAAMFAALICVATMIIRIPSPIGGYLNFGDCFILVAAWILGPVYGFAAGGIGSALADLFSGYPVYAPGTFVIKGLIALAAALIVGAMIKKSPKLRVPGFILGSVVGELIMVGGYYLYESTLLGYGFIGGLEGLPMNFLQALFGAVLGVVLILVIAKTGVFSRLNKNFSAYAV